MVLRKLTNQDLPAAKKLWMEAFGDSEEFVRFYFANKFKFKNSLGAFIKNTLAGDITMQEMNVRMRGVFLKTGFLAGCATKNEFRYQGVMQSLLAAQMAEMNRNGYAVCHLHPFLHAFYRKFGWETVSHMRRVTVRPIKNYIDAKENAFDFDRIFMLYKNFCGNADGYFDRSPREMSIRLNEHMNDGGFVIATGSGYAMYFVQDGYVDVIEMVAQKPEINELLAMLSVYLLPIRYYIPDYAGRTGKLEEYTMMRVVNAKRLLQSIRLADSSFSIGVRDDFCPWNNVRLLLRCSQEGVHVEDYPGAHCDTEVDIRELSALAAGRDSGNTGFLKGIFTNQKACFFNTY